MITSTTANRFATITSVTVGTTYYARVVPGGYAITTVLPNNYAIIGSTVVGSAGSAAPGTLFTSIASSSWSLSSTWNQCGIPGASNPVIISSWTTVTVDISTATASTTTIYGDLQFSRTNSSTFTVVGGSVSVNAGGTLDMGTAASPINASSATLILAYGQTAGHFGLVVNPGGNFLVYGGTKTPEAPGTGTASGTNVPVVSTRLRWSVGDTVTVDTEAVTITVLTGSALAVSPALGLTHSTPTVVADLSRNVLIRSSGTDTTANTAYIQSLVTNATSFNVTYGEFAYLGANVAGQDGINLETNAQGTISSSTIRNGYNGVDSGNAAANCVFTSNPAFLQPPE